MVLPPRSRALRMGASTATISRGYSSRAGAHRGAHVCRSSSRGKPIERLAGDGIGHGMWAVELPIVDLIALAI
jgi:hypothetical protein